MANTSGRTLQAFASTALAVSGVGTWEYDVAADRLRCDGTMAALYGLSAEEGERGVSLARIRGAIHPEDRPRGIAKGQRMMEHGGLFVIEYRTRPGPGDLRWVLVRGVYEADARGAVAVGRGIVIDVTDSKQDGYVEGQAFFLSGAPSEQTRLDRVAELALAVRHAVDGLGARGRAALRPLVDALLMGVGRRLAAHLDGEPERDAGRDGKRRRPN